MSFKLILYYDTLKLIFYDTTLPELKKIISDRKIKEK